MTTTTPTTSTQDAIAADPHGLGDTNEAVADEPELHARYGVTGTWLRLLRRQRRVRYVDLAPQSPPGSDATTRYLYCISDIARERARVETAHAPPTAPTPPKPAPKPSPQPPSAPPRPPHTRGRHVTGRCPRWWSCGGGGRRDPP